MTNNLKKINALLQSPNNFTEKMARDYCLAFAELDSIASKNSPTEKTEWAAVREQYLEKLAISLIQLLDSKNLPKKLADQNPTEDKIIDEVLETLKTTLTEHEANLLSKCFLKISTQNMSQKTQDTIFTFLTEVCTHSANQNKRASQYVPVQRFYMTLLRDATNFFTQKLPQASQDRFINLLKAIPNENSKKLLSKTVLSSNYAEPTKSGWFSALIKKLLPRWLSRPPKTIMFDGTALETLQKIASQPKEKITAMPLPSRIQPASRIADIDSAAEPSPPKDSVLPLQQSATFALPLVEAATAAPKQAKPQQAAISKKPEATKQLNVVEDGKIKETTGFLDSATFKMIKVDQTGRVLEEPASHIKRDKAAAHIMSIIYNRTQGKLERDTKHTLQTFDKPQQQMVRSL